MLNKGISFGLFPGVSGILVAFVLLGLVMYARKVKDVWGRVGVILIIIGGAGNLYSRLVYGGVVDNLNFFGLFYNNVWDYLITVGIVIYIYSLWKTKIFTSLN